MEPTAFEYSTKNIPLPSENEYIRSMIVKTEDLCKTMRWKTFFHLNPHITANGMGTYGFKSRRAPPQIADLVNFKSDLIKMIHNIKFRNSKSKFQKDLAKNVHLKISTSDKLLVAADKTSNFYKMTTPECKKLLRKQHPRAYKKVGKETVNKRRRQYLKSYA